MRYLMLVLMLLLLLGIPGYAQGAERYTLFVGEFENRTDIANPLLSYVSDTLSFLFSRSKLADIRPIPAGLRSAYLQRARNEQPNVDATELNLLAAEYGKADAVLLGSYSKTGAQWTMDTQLYVTRGGGRAKEDIRLTGEDVYRLLDGLAAEVSKRLGAGEYTLLSTPSWEAYEAYRQGHQAYYSFDTLGAIRHFQHAIELDPQLAIAHAELGLCHLMLNDIPKVDKAMAEAEKNMQNVSEQERFIVTALTGYYKASRHAFLKAANIFPDLPSMRDDTVWDEPWLHLQIARSSGDESTRDREYKQWLTSALAYAKAGFYGALELAEAGVERRTEAGSNFGRCVSAFNATRDPQFLEAALQFIEQAAGVEANDEYDDAWKHWELSRIYRLMDRDTDVHQQRDEWLSVVKSKSLDSLSTSDINDIARKCLEIGRLKDALDFASSAIELETDTEFRSQYLVTLADIRSASGELDEAFSLYLETFEASERGHTGTGVLDGSLLGLTRLISDNPEFVDEAIRVKLNQMIETIDNMDPLLFRSESAQQAVSDFSTIRNFCWTVGNIGPLLTVVRGILKAETSPSEQLVYLSYLSQFEGGISDYESELIRDMLRTETEPSDELRYLAYLSSSEAGELSLVPNGGFEFGFAGWKNLWTREPGAVTAMLDEDIRHSGNRSVRIDHTGEREWALEPKAMIPVYSGDVFELSAWLKIGKGMTKICVVTYDENGEVVEWEFARQSHSGESDWSQTTSRFVIPDGIREISPRLIGTTGPAQVWMDDFVLSRLTQFEGYSIAGKEREIIRSMLEVETEPMEQLKILSRLSQFEGGITGSERNLTSSPEFHKAVSNRIHELSEWDLLRTWVSIKLIYRNVGDESFLLELAEQIQQTKADNLRGKGITHLLLEPVESIKTGSSEFTEQFAQDPVAAGWEWVDPIGDCGYQLEKGARLQITAPSRHDLWPGSNYDAPRLLRPASGDFIIETIVPDGSVDERCGGLVVWRDKQNYIRFEIASGNIWFAGGICYAANADGKWIHPGVHPFKADKFWLRLERKRDRVTGYISADGENWYICGWADILMKDPVKVGIYALCFTTPTSSVLFEQFTLYRPE